MTISSSKSTSAGPAAAALLLMVTVLLVSGAEAQFTITNTCNRTITINSPVGTNVTISPNNTVTITSATPPVTFFTNATGTIGLPTATGSVSFTVPPSVTTVLNIFNFFTGTVVRIVITCQGDCVTITGVFQVPFFGSVTAQLAQICPTDLVTP